MEKRVEEIVKILSAHPSIVKVKPGYRLQSKLIASGLTYEKIYSCPIHVDTDRGGMILTVYEKNYTLFENVFTTFRSDDETKELNLKMLLERIGGLSEEHIESLATDPSSYPEVFHHYRGAVAARRFGF